MYNRPVRVDLHVIQFIQHEAQEARTFGNIRFELGGGYPSDRRALEIGNVLDAESIERIHGLSQLIFIPSKV